MHTEEPFKVFSFERGGLANLLDQLKPLVEVRKPLPLNSAYGMKIEYLIYSPTWRTSVDTPLGFHLKNPDSITLVYSAYNLFIDCNYIRHGQVVCHESSKAISNNGSNVLIVTFIEIAEKLHTYDKVFEHKLLEWYLEYCNKNTRVPTHVEFVGLKKKLQKNHKTFQKKSFTLANLPQLNTAASEVLAPKKDS